MGRRQSRVGCKRSRKSELLVVDRPISPSIVLACNETPHAHMTMFKKRMRYQKNSSSTIILGVSKIFYVSQSAQQRWLQGFDWFVLVASKKSSHTKCLPPRHETTSLVSVKFSNNVRRVTIATGHKGTSFLDNHISSTVDYTLTTLVERNLVTLPDLTVTLAE